MPNEVVGKPVFRRNVLPQSCSSHLPRAISRHRFCVIGNAVLVRFDLMRRHLACRRRVHFNTRTFSGSVGTQGNAPFARDSRNDPEVLVHAEDVSALAPPGIRDDEMHFVGAYEYRFLHLVPRVMPTSGPQFLEEVGGMVSRLRPIETLRPGKHDMRKVEFTVHSVCIARVEKSSEAIEAF